MAMSPDEQALYKSIVANLPFTRHQQGGVIAGYAVAAVIALYGLTRDKIKPNLVEILIWFVVAGSIVGCYLILRIQLGIASQRRAFRRVARPISVPSRSKRSAFRIDCRFCATLILFSA